MAPGMTAQLRRPAAARAAAAQSRRARQCTAPLPRKIAAAELLRGPQASASGRLHCAPARRGGRLAVSAGGPEGGGGEAPAALGSFDLLLTAGGSAAASPAAPAALAAASSSSSGGSSSGSSDGSSDGEQLEGWTSSDDGGVKIDLQLPRRSLLVTFTCDACSVRTERLVNPVAWHKGLVIAQCGGCKAWHKLADAANLIDEIRYADLEDEA